MKKFIATAVLGLLLLSVDTAPSQARSFLGAQRGFRNVNRAAFRGTAFRNVVGVAGVNRFGYGNNAFFRSRSFYGYGSNFAYAPSVAVIAPSYDVAPVVAAAAYVEQAAPQVFAAPLVASVQYLAVPSYAAFAVVPSCYGSSFGVGYNGIGFGNRFNFGYGFGHGFGRFR